MPGPYSYVRIHFYCYYWWSWCTEHSDKDTSKVHSALLATPPNAKCTRKKKGQRGSWSRVRSSGWQGKYPDARQGQLFSMMASGMLAYPTDICVGCCVAIPGKFGKQLAATKPHTAFHLSWIRLTGNAITSSSERTALLFPSQPIPDPPGSQALP